VTDAGVGTGAGTGVETGAGSGVGFGAGLGTGLGAGLKMGAGEETGLLALSPDCLLSSVPPPQPLRSTVLAQSAIDTVRFENDRLFNAIYKFSVEQW
jgi:hypothetical protein